jgi:hypothetical protein
MPPRKGISMARSIRSRPLYLLLALAIVAAPALAARHRESQPVRKAPPSLAAQAWTELLRLFAPLGAEMDLNGAKAGQPATPLTTSTIQPPPTTDLGGQMDPDG